MPADSSITEYIEKAQAAGIPHESQVGILTAHGWPEKEIYRALADHYRDLTGIEIPRRTRSEASAREAFFYLLIFATLAAWTIGLGSVASALIDRWVADPLFMGYGQTADTAIASSLAAMIVAFPLYLLFSRIVIREAKDHTERRDSPVRKWLTYMALVIAASVFMGQLIGALGSLLRGELTLRFVATSLVVLSLSGGVFFYYYGGLRKGDSARPDTNRWMAGLSSAVVLGVVFLGFWQLGSPATQRSVRADGQRIHQLYQLTQGIKTYWGSHASQLPSRIDQLLGTSDKDPITGAPYEYHPGQGTSYELCASFARASDSHAIDFDRDPWVHPAGRHCFQFDASIQPEFPSTYF